MSDSLQLAFLTGQSDPRQSVLSPAQRQFALSLPIAPTAIVPHNFPYPMHGDKAPPETDWRPTPLLTASFRNTRQYLVSRQKGFAAQWRRPVLDMLARADRTLVLAGSCGLELLSNLRLSADELRGVRVVAYGPVARSVPEAPCVSVVGDRDWLSRRFFPTPDAVVRANHLNYLESSEFHRVVVAELADLQRSEPGAIPESGTPR
ncbi:hypothetical protein G7068_00650 [Leucobacter viscericola]|uniref:Uncharacterized protein n=1 Tax=Leucobacter viscericola TaxID=2714935 RepID=A0A6G7XBV6_9MICO|nr:hypothetical protein [Leucobacter viscericola]QIK61887.1 hypothetical protein G7068_00650 [Leucobacter viscericola]